MANKGVVAGFILQKKCNSPYFALVGDNK